MEEIFYELSILSKASGYKNLTLASQNIGLSQPQLSRIVAKIEQTLHVSLLDRSAKRKSGWTTEAFKLVHLYSQSIRKFQNEVELFKTGGHVKSLKIACLEGHMDFVLAWVNKLYEELTIRNIEVNIYDIDLLEKNFLKGNYDLVLTARDIGKKKFQYQSILGHQFIKIQDDKSDTIVLSPFELNSRQLEVNAKVHKKILVSNSLQLRKRWLYEMGGKGSIPSPILHRKNSREGIPVTLLAQDTFHPELWKGINDCAKKALTS